jgi:segregation and condensation protein A
MPIQAAHFLPIFPLARIAATPSILPLVLPDTDYRIKLPAFEGPLDLLLFLIRKNEIDIYDIPIESVTRQYIAILKSLKELDLEIAGDFFVMAATLMEIKSRMLLPKGEHAVGPPDDDPIDPRYELVHQLLQYKKFKEAAQGLQDLATFNHDKLPRIVKSDAPTEDERPLKNVGRIDLWNSYNIILRRLAEKLVVGEIKDEQVTIADQMEYILTRIRTEKSFIFSSLFPGKTTLRVLVATFIAVLELTRLRKLRIRQDEAYSDILCTAVEDEPDAATTTSASESFTSEFDAPPASSTPA